MSRKAPPSLSSSAANVVTLTGGGGGSRLSPAEMEAVTPSTHAPTSGDDHALQMVRCSGPRELTTHISSFSAALFRLCYDMRNSNIRRAKCLCGARVFVQALGKMVVDLKDPAFQELLGESVKELTAGTSITTEPDDVYRAANSTAGAAAATLFGSLATNTGVQGAENLSRTLEVRAAGGPRCDDGPRGKILYGRLHSVPISAFTFSSHCAADAAAPVCGFKDRRRRSARSRPRRDKGRSSCCDGSGASCWLGELFDYLEVGAQLVA